MVYLFKKFASWIIPHVCILCRNLTNRPQDICLPCLQQLPFLKYSCTACANVLPPTSSQMLCGQCLKENPPFDETYGLFLYEPPVSKLILDLKFHHRLTHAKLFGELLAEKN